MEAALKVTLENAPLSAFRPHTPTANHDAQFVFTNQHAHEHKQRMGLIHNSELENIKITVEGARAFFRIYWRYGSCFLRTRLL